MLIQYFSNVHLEFLKTLPTLRPVATIACIAGDIGYPFSELYKLFHIYLSSIFQPVFIITGNHEYYAVNENKDYSMNDINSHIQEIINKNNLSNICFLNNTCHDYNSTRFVGTTLWTQVTNKNFLINDYKYKRKTTS